MMEWKDIYEGWKNHLFPSKKLREYIHQVSEERLAICKPCEFNSTTGRIGNLSICRKCGCPLKQKSKALHLGCPIEKWFAVANVAESEEINKQLNNES